MTAVLTATAFLGLLLAATIAVRGWAGLRYTTLQPAAAWLVAAVAVCLLVIAPEQAADWLTPELRDQLSLLTVILLLCPPVYGLGARRPVNRVWPWFVLGPMMFVLGLPALTLWQNGRPAELLRLEAPALLGPALVTLMSCGNWLGTRFTLAAVAYAAAIGLLTTSVADHPPQLLEDRHLVRLWAALCLGAAALLARKRSVDSLQPRDRLWQDFRDTFGMVWARRMMDRVNHTARAQRWPVRLGLDGFTPANEQQTADRSTAAARSTEPDSQETTAAIDYTLGWLLRRFVDEGWISQRCPELLDRAKCAAAAPPPTD